MLQNKIMRQMFIASILFFTASLALSATECIGPENAKKSIVYLHGMDTESPSSQELGNRAVLNELAKKLNIRFALPRAKEKCPPNPKQVCWTWAAKTSADLANVKATITSAASDCFSNKDYSVLGFSNGGVAVTAMLRLCEKVDFKYAVVIGAAGGWFSTDPKNLKDCNPSLISLLGSKDTANQKPVRDLISHLVSLKAPAALVEYDGDHRLLYAPLANLLK